MVIHDVLKGHDMRSTSLLIIAVAASGALVSCRTTETESSKPSAARQEQQHTRRVFRISGGTRLSTRHEDDSHYVNLTLDGVHTRHLLPLYQELSGKHVVVDDEVDAVVTIDAGHVTREQSLEIIEKSLLEAGVILIKVDDKTIRASRVKEE